MTAHLAPRAVAAGVVALAVTGSACGRHEPTTHTVRIEQMRFVPADLVVRRGDSVAWVNGDLVPHTVVSGAGAFASGVIPPGGSWNWTVDAIERMPYACSLHPTMKAELEVRQAVVGWRFVMDTGDLVPHFTVTTLNGDVVSYETSWQRRHMVLVFTAGQPAGRYVEDVARAVPDFAALSAVFVVTAQPVGDLREPTLVVADRWGEIVAAQRAPGIDELPGGAHVRRWLEYLEIRCPECEGEAR